MHGFKLCTIPRESQEYSQYQHNPQTSTYLRKTPELSAGPIPSRPLPADLAPSGGPLIGEAWAPALHLQCRKKGFSTMAVSGYPKRIEMPVWQQSVKSRKLPQHLPGSGACRSRRAMSTSSGLAKNEGCGAPGGSCGPGAGLMLTSPSPAEDRISSNYLMTGSRNYCSKEVTLENASPSACPPAPPAWEAWALSPGKGSSG